VGWECASKLCAFDLRRSTLAPSRSSRRRSPCRARYCAFWTSGANAAPGAASVATAVEFIDRRPGAAYGLFSGDAALFVGLLDVLSFALLLVRVFGFVASRHLVSFGIPAIVELRILFPARLPLRVAAMGSAACELALPSNLLPAPGMSKEEAAECPGLSAETLMTILEPTAGHT